MRWVALLLVLLVTACATYLPEPLKLKQSTLADPIASIVEQKASQVERPWLAPVTIDLAAPLTRDGIAAIAVLNNPDLAALRARAGIAGAQVFAAGLLPDPNFSLGANKVLRGPDTLLDLTAGLGLDIASLRTRAVRRQEALAHDQQVRLDLAWAEWQTAGQARLQATRINRLGKIVDLARQSRNSTQSLLDRITRAAIRGDTAGDRLQAARLAVLTSSENLRTSEKELETAHVDLVRLLGLPPGYALRLAAPLPFAPPPPTSVLFPVAEANRTDLAALREGYKSQEAVVRRAVLEQFPNLGLSLNTQRDSAGNLLAGPAINFTMPLWNRNRGVIAVERATREALRTEYDARLFQTRSDLYIAEARVAVSQQSRADALAALPQLERYATASRRAADRGDLSHETAENAEQALRDRQTQLVRAKQDLEEQMIALELLTGTQMGAWPR